MISCTLFIIMHTICISYFLFGKLTVPFYISEPFLLEYGILIGYTIIILYLFCPHFNAYGAVNGFFIYITDTEQKQIQPCCNSTIIVTSRTRGIAPAIFRETSRLGAVTPWNKRVRIHSVQKFKTSPTDTLSVVTRKRSLGQGNVLTPVCDYVHRGRGCIPACNRVDTPPRQTPRPSDATGHGQQAGGTHPTGMHTCC